MADLIERQQAIDALRAMQTYKMFAGDDLLLIDQAGAQTELMMLPSAQPEHRMGRWYDVGSLSCRCSECGCKSQKESLFCPNCGADMRGEQE